MHKSVVQPQVIPDVCWTSLNNHANLLCNDVCPWLMEQIWAHAFSYSKIIKKDRRLRSRLIADIPKILFSILGLSICFSASNYTAPNRFEQISTRFPSLILGKMGHNKKMSTGTADYRRNAPEGASIWNFDSVKIWTWTIHDQWCHLMSFVMSFWYHFRCYFANAIFVLVNALQCNTITTSFCKDHVTNMFFAPCDLGFQILAL